jgi:hypothetical protein
MALSSTGLELKILNLAYTSCKSFAINTTRFIIKQHARRLSWRSWGLIRAN